MVVASKYLLLFANCHVYTQCPWNCATEDIFMQIYIVYIEQITVPHPFSPSSHCLLIACLSGV